MSAKVQDLHCNFGISQVNLEAINGWLTAPGNRLLEDVLKIVDKYGGVAEINRRAREAGNLDNLMGRLGAKKSPYVKDLVWLIERRDKDAFITLADYRRQVLGIEADRMTFDDSFAVTLEISALQYFPWLIAEAKQALANRELMPGRFIRVRRMQEQESDDDLLAVAAAMNIIGASWCETLDTKGTDGSNVHLGGPATITGYFAGIGQPNDYPLRWLDEYLYYHTNYGVKQVLNFNPGTILLALLLYKLGVNNECKISVYAGYDNPYSILWILTMAKLFCREDNTTALAGLNFANSVKNETIQISAGIRKALGFEDNVRFEHHILESCKSIVCQPYDRREELLALSRTVRNFSAKHEGGEISIESQSEHPSDILDYFMSKQDVLNNNMMPAMLKNYLDKHDALNATARALTEHGVVFVAAKRLHK
jgi:hypothetical protein